MAKCSPHNWETPAVGDDGVVCHDCGRKLSFMDDITPNIRGSIMNGYERRSGPDTYEEFKEAFNAAFDDSRLRRFGPRVF